MSCAANFIGGFLYLRCSNGLGTQWNEATDLKGLYTLLWVHRSCITSITFYVCLQPVRNSLRHERKFLAQAILNQIRQRSCLRLIDAEYTLILTLRNNGLNLLRPEEPPEMDVKVSMCLGLSNGIMRRMFRDL